MQAIILAAGQSSRLYPFSLGMHKSMISLCGKPLLQYTIEGLKKAGIKQVIIVVDPKSPIPQYFGSGEKFGISLLYVTQKDPLGMGNALLLAQDKLEDNFLLLHPHHIEIENIAEELFSLKKEGIQAVLLTEQREATWKYGVVKLNENKILDVVEKPKKGNEPSKQCLVGIYLLQKNLLDVVKKIPLEHYQFEKALAEYVKENTVLAVEAKTKTITLKYPWDLLEIKSYLLQQQKKTTGKNVSIAKSAQITGEVVIEDNVTIMEGVVVKGPCYIGKNVLVGNNAILRNEVVVEENCVVGANMEVKNSVIMKGTKTHSGFMGDSVIGENCHIAAQFCTGNVRLDRKSVKTVIKNEEVETEQKHLGVMVGKNTKIGIKSSTMPGIIIGNNVTVGPLTVVLHNIEDDTTYYTKFQEIVEKK